ncbi:MAG: GntR family transcriptional regulator [Rhodospirillales bacterium]|jgi:DNA-binding GntR family transcriptional regulator
MSADGGLQAAERYFPAPEEIEHGSVGEVVYGQIRNDILLGVLPPSTKLKLEYLRRTYAVSINTLRETLARLAADGLVEAEGQKGFRVIPASIADLREVTELRQLLECHALRQSIKTGGIEWEGRLVAAHHMLARSEQAMMKDSAAHAQEWQKFDREFHVALISACNSRWILRVHRMIHDQFRRYQMLALRTIGFRGQALIDEHRQILDDALARDADAATARLAAHIQQGAELPVGDAPPAA